MDILKQYAKKPRVLFRGVQGEGFLVCQDSGRILGLNQLGSRIFEALERNLSTEELLEQLQEEFDVSKEQLTQDIQAFLSSLEEYQVVKGPTA